jgi:hypothetical protein
MHSQPNPAHHAGIPADSVGSAEDSFDEALLGLLTHDHTGLWSLAELSRSLTSSAQTAATGEVETCDTEDAIERLHAAGLIHRLGGFVFATRAAHAAQRLAS